MSTDARVAVLEGAPIASRFQATAADYWALTKPDINFLILIATSAGFFLGRPADATGSPALPLVHTLVGTVLVAAGAGTLNQYMERRFDARMRRTARRPLAAGRLGASSVLWFGAGLSVTGAVYLAAAVNPQASLLATVTVGSYLGVYTPLKRKSALCTLVGTVPGAIPPLIGWAGASGGLSFEALVLFGTLFLWQFPHFMAIAWMYREDYSRAGYRVLSEGQRGARLMSLQAVVASFALIPVSLYPAISGQAGPVYVVAASLLGAAFLYCSVGLAVQRTSASARRLLMASILYLPLIFLLMVIAKYCRVGSAALPFTR